MSDPVEQPKRLTAWSLFGISAKRWQESESPCRPCVWTAKCRVGTTCSSVAARHSK